eukprot:g3055.t1
MALEDVLEFRFGKGVIGKWAAGWFCLQNGQLEQYGEQNGERDGQEVRKVWDLFDANEFHYDAEKGELTLQCGNERLRFRGRDSVLRKWFEKMRGFVPKEVQPSQTFQPPVRRVEMEVPIQEAGPSTPAPPSETVSSPSRKSRANSRASFFNKPLEHLKSNERLDPSVATTLSKPTQSHCSTWSSVCCFRVLYGRSELV